MGSFKKEIKAIKMLQDRNKQIESMHNEISSDINEIKASLASLCEDIDFSEDDKEFQQLKQTYLQSGRTGALIKERNIKEIYQEAERRYQDVNLSDILTPDEIRETNNRINQHIKKFNQQYDLDGYDYAIAGGCGLFAAMLDMLCIKAPLKPTTNWTTQVDGIFNQSVQKAFNKLIPPSFSKTLSQSYAIGAPDTSVTRDLLDGPAKALNPLNHRLRALSHDPILGFIFGVLDMMRGTCTAVVNGKIVVMPTKKAPVTDNVFQLLGRMCGHLLSDVNAPSAHENRGMGLPAPFMGLLRMFDSIKVGDSTIDKQIESMYVRGYDFRHFVTVSIPVTVMEVMMRALYTGKQVSLYNADFGSTLLETMPFRLNPRFRIMLAIGYGVISSINFSKVYVTHNIMNANYSAWMGFVWNTFHALKWLLIDKQIKMWDYVTEQEIARIESVIKDIDSLDKQSQNLPI